jgi:hypothetical protein
MYGSSPSYLGGYGVETNVGQELYQWVTGSGEGESEVFPELDQTSPGDPEGTSAGGIVLEANLLRSKTIRTPAQLVDTVSLVFDGVKAETGKTDAAKEASLSGQAAAATTTAKKVAVLQSLAAYAKDQKAVQVENAIRTGVANEFWQNVESQESTGLIKKKSVDDMLKLPVYRRPWFVPTVGASALVVALLIWKPWR